MSLFLNLKSFFLIVKIYKGEEHESFKSFYPLNKLLCERKINVC